MTDFIVIMGVSGCGKTTVAEALADRIGGVFMEGDSYHPPENKEKMGNAIPLTDEDRWPWFDALIAGAKNFVADRQIPVLACSALKEEYRDYLFRDFQDHRLVYLEGSFDVIKDRMDARDHEYMTAELLQSQFDTLEVPEPGPMLLTISIEKTPDEILEEIVAWLED